VHACTMALQTCRVKGKDKTQGTDQILSFKRSGPSVITTWRLLLSWRLRALSVATF